MKLFATFIPDRDAPGAYRLSFLREDAKTPIGFSRRVRDVASLVRIIGKLGGYEEIALHALRSWGQGSCPIEPNIRQMEWIEANRNKGM